MVATTATATAVLATYQHELLGRRRPVHDGAGLVDGLSAHVEVIATVDAELGLLDRYFGRFGDG